MADFDFTRLTVYRRALEFLASAEVIARRLPQGRAHFVDQLERAALSISLNIAEGAGEFSRKEKARFYRIAKRSSTESAALLYAAVHLRLMPRGEIDAGLQQLHEIVSMLTRMVINIDERSPAASTKRPG